jgi:hypothetical protein
MFVEKATLSASAIDDLTLATAVREACVRAALTAYDDAAMNGLCHEGAWECAVDAMRSLNIERLLDELHKESRSR